MVRIFFDVFREVTKNAAMSLPLVRTWRVRRGRTSPRFDNRTESLERYAFHALRHLLPVLGSVNNLRIFEIGPGDHLANGLALLAAGAASYTAIDRFPGDYAGSAAKEWYRGVQEQWSHTFPDLPWPDYLDPNTFPEAYPDRVKVLSKSIESVCTADGATAINGYHDVVCSFYLAEHVSDIAVFASKAQSLAPEGVGVHLIDFRPHQYWEQYPDKLTFLRLPDWIWWMMGSARGTPNRRRFHELLAAFEAAGLSVDVTVQEKLPESAINRNKLAWRFRQMPVESLAIMRAIFVCRPSRPAMASANDHEDRASVTP